MNLTVLALTRMDEGLTDDEVRAVLHDLADAGRVKVGDMPDIAKIRKQWDGEGRRARAHAKTVEIRPQTNAPTDGAKLLDQVYEFIGRFVAYPSDHAQVAHTLWIAHTHAMDTWESTPRLAALSEEPASGKTRLLEVTEPLVPRPVEAVNVTPAYLFRKVADEDGRPTILYDEIDTVFGPKAKENEELRGLINAGHRKGAVAGRCVVVGKQVKTEEIPAYCAVALAGLRDLPDTIMSRAVVLRMRRRAPDEQVEAWRRRINGKEGHEIREQLALWAEGALPRVIDTWPDMPKGVTDRDADVWEALIAIADVAGGKWPGLARAAAVALVKEGKESSPSLGVRLLSDIRDAFGDQDKLPTETILRKLIARDDAPWGDMRGKPLNDIQLSRRLKGYGIKPKLVRIGSDVARGYAREDFHDAWRRYLPPIGANPVTPVTDVTEDVK